MTSSAANYIKSLKDHFRANPISRNSTLMDDNIKNFVANQNMFTNNQDGVQFVYNTLSLIADHKHKTITHHEFMKMSAFTEIPSQFVSDVYNSIV
jgi:hypothetical protein